MGWNRGAVRSFPRVTRKRGGGREDAGGCRKKTAVVKDEGFRLKIQE